MKFRWLGFLISGFAFILSFSTVNAECSWGFISCTHPQGTGSDIVFNSLEYSRSKYFWNTDQCVSDSDVGSTTQIPGPNDDCLLWRNESLNGFTNTFTDAQCLSFGASAVPGFGCACLEPTCVVNYVNGDNRIKESHFASARKCLNGSCNSRDPLGYNPGQSGYQSVPTYEHSLSGTAALGDKVRVQVYSHDNATEQFPGDPNYNNYMANNTDIKLSWNNTTHTAQGIVTSPDATPVTKTSPSITLPVLPSGSQYEIIGVWHHYNSATSAGTPNYVAEYFTPADNELSVNGTTATFNLGDHASSFGNVHRTYFDLQVVQTAITDFTLTKSANPGTNVILANGDSITYSIMLTNTGNTTLSSTTVTDSLNSDLTFISGDSNVTHQNGLVTISFNPLSVGATATASFIVEVNDGAGPQVCNSATGINNGITKTSNQVCHQIELFNPGFTISKGASPAPGSAIHPGESITYSITTTNTGDDMLPSFIATDTLDPNLTFVSGDAGVTANGQTVTLSFGNIPFNATVTKNFTVSINTNTPTPSQICNQATATNSGITQTSQNICHTITDASVTDFSLAKSANPVSGSHVEVGDTITYTVSTTNTGNTTLSSVIGTDTLNSHLVFVTGDSGVSHVNGIVTIQFTNIAPGATASKNFEVTVDSMPTPAWILNTFSATVAGITKTSNQTTHYIDTTNAPDFTLEKTAVPATGTPLHPGGTITYTITATNTGNTVLPNFTATDTLDANLTFVSGDTGVSHIGQTVTLSFGNMAVGASATKNFVVSVNANTPTPSQVCNQATATNSGITHASQNICHNVTDPVTVNFGLIKSANPGNNSTVTPGDTITYTLTAFNTGNTPLNNLVLTDILNQNVQYEGSTNPNVSYNATTHTVTATFATLPVASQVSAPFSVTVKDTAATGIGFCNEAVGVANDLTITSNSVCHYIVNEEVSLTKTADVPAGTPVDPGQILTYTISATNNTADVLDIIVTDPLDTLLEFVGSASSNLTYDAGTHTVEVAFANVASGATVTASFQGMVLDPGAAGVEVCNELSLVSTSPGGTGGGGGNTAAIFENLVASTIGGGGTPVLLIPEQICHPINWGTLLPDFQIVKSANPSHGSTVVAGDTIAYTITATNTGTTPLSPLVITDVLNPNVEFPTQFTNVSYDPATHTVTKTFPNVSPGTTVTAQFYVVIKDTAATGIGICNEAVGVASGLTITSNSVCHYIVSEEVSLAKTADVPAGTPVDPGQILTYTISATNNTTGTLNILVTDPLDTLLEFIGSASSNLTYDAGTHTVSVLFNNVAALQTVSASFQARVLDPGAPNMEVCNEVTLVSTAPGTPGIGGFFTNVLNTLENFFAPIQNFFKSLTSSIFDINTLENLVASTLTPPPKPLLPNKICHPVIVNANDLIVLTKESDPLPGSVVTTGDTIDYTVQIINNSGNTITETILDQLDPGLSFLAAGSISSNDPLASGTMTFDPVLSIISFQVFDLGDTASMTFTFTAEVITTNDVQICNQAVIPYFQGNPYKSANICVSVAGEPIVLTKTSDPVSGSTVVTGDTVLYKVRITNNSGASLTNTILDPLDPGLSFVAAGSISSSDAGATGTISFDGTTSLLSLGIKNLGNGEWMIFEFSTEVIAANNGTEVCNQAHISDIQGQLYESENICLTVDNGGSGGNTFIEKSVSPTGTIANGDTLTYTIRMTSDETTAFSTLLNDTLDSHLIYLGNEVITAANTSITGAITHDGSATGGLVELTVNDLANGWIEFSFDVLIEGIGTSDQICNQAIEKDGNWFSNIICSSTEGGGGGGGGGGGQTISTIGICSDLLNGSVTCRKHTPHPSFGEEAYETWKECKKNATNEELKICTHDWAAAVGLLAIGECHPDDITSNQTLGMWNPYNGYYVWNGGLSDENNECNAPLLDPCTPCNEIEASIVKTTTTPAVAKEENAHYTAILSLDKTEPAGANVKITGIKVYDLTIPAESGWIYNHAMAGNSEWVWNGTPDDPASNYFEFSGGSFDLFDNRTFVLDYEMNTALTIKADTAQVKNVAFAVIEYQIEQAEGLWSNPSTFYVGNPSIDACQDLTILDIIHASTSTLGTSATVKIIRPFVEVRGGGNVGVQKLDDTTENPFGGLQTGGEFEDTLSTGETLTGEETDDLTETENLWDEFEGQTSSTEEFFGRSWQTTPDNSGVYFVEGNVTLTEENAQDLTGTSKTFVINGTLTIESNFEPAGFGAFIANEIIINPTVTKMTGVFIADTGNIISPEISYAQLVVSGSLMGNATNLLDQRKFIGTNPLTQLEPSIKINYDLRLLDATPPALELFLSEDWTQSTEE